MEKFYVVKEGSQLYSDYFAWKENRIVVRKTVREFFKELGIEADIYLAADDGIGIAPTENDEKLYGKLLSINENRGVREFKRVSTVHKRWLKLLEEKNLKVLWKPMPIIYMSLLGKSRSRLFDQNDILYCSIDCDEIKPVDFLEEMAGSEFHKVMEAV